MAIQRPSWSDYWDDIVEKVATRSTCNRLKVGAIIVLNNRLIASGYNGSPSGEPHCLDEGCIIVPCFEHGEHCDRTDHAEINAVSQVEWLVDKVLSTANLGWTDDLFNTPNIQRELIQDFLKDAEMITTHRPCHDCHREIRMVGIRKVRWLHDYGLRPGD